MVGQTKKIEGVTYEACIGNIVWDVIAVETIVIPIQVEKS